MQQLEDKVQQEWQGDSMRRGRRKNRLSSSLGVYTSNFVEGISIVNLVHWLTTLLVCWPIHQIFPLANWLTCTPNGQPLCQSVDLLANGKIWRMGRNTYIYLSHSWVHEWQYCPSIDGRLPRTVRMTDLSIYGIEVARQLSTSPRSMVRTEIVCLGADSAILDKAVKTKASLIRHSRTAWLVTY